MNNNSKRNESCYFTAGELASMYGISKQSLLYYDKIHLLSPDFISPNGYRHYSITQYLDLEIIVNLRALDIPINDIQKYLQNRGREQLEEIFVKKDNVCQEIIRENQRIRKALSVITGKINEEQKELRNQVLIRSYPTRYIKLTQLSENDNGKDRIVLFARASHKNLHNRCLLEKQQGWIIRQEDFFSGHCSNESTAFFFFLSGPVKKHEEYFSNAKKTDAGTDAAGNTQAVAKRLRRNTAEVATLPESLYCETTFDGTFYDEVDTISKKILKQLERYKLRPVSDIYVLPVHNHWFTADPTAYVTKVFLRVMS